MTTSSAAKIIVWLACIFYTTSAARAEDSWIFVAEATKGDKLFVTPTTKDYHIWTLTEHIDGTKDISRDEIDCPNQRYRRYQVTTRDQQGLVIYSYVGLSGWIYGTPGSLGNELVKFICAATKL